MFTEKHNGKHGDLIVNVRIKESENLLRPINTLDVLSRHWITLGDAVLGTRLAVNTV